MPSSPKLAKRRRARSFASTSSDEKVKRVLGYGSDSVGKVSELLGVDEDTIHEFHLEQVELECRKKRSFETTIHKRNSKKALIRLGYDPSVEKIKQLMGLDDQDITELEQFRVREHELKTAYLRELRTSVNKRRSYKALDRLGVDVSVHKASKVLGAEEDVIREANHIAGLEQDAHVRQKRLSASLCNKKSNKKAFSVVGYDPSLEKAANVLGIEVGSADEAELRTLIPVSDGVQIVGRDPVYVEEPVPHNPLVTLGLTISTLAFVAFQVINKS